MKKGLLTMAGVLLTVSLVSAGTTVPVLAEEETNWREGDNHESGCGVFPDDLSEYNP